MISAGASPNEVNSIKMVDVPWSYQSSVSFKVSAKHSEKGQGFDRQVIFSILMMLIYPAFPNQGLKPN